MSETLHSIGEIAAAVSQASEQSVHLACRLRSAIEPDETAGGDPAAMVRGALEQPLEFPPLAAATVPGDRVAIAVGSDIPQVGQIVRGAMESLEKAGIDPGLVSIVAIDSETRNLCREGLQNSEGVAPAFVVHDPDDDENLCLVGLTKRKQPLVVNRTIFDADIVLPIGCAHANSSPYDSLFPDFSSAAAIEQYRIPANFDSADSAQRLAKEATEAGWLIGTLMALQIVPGPNESVAHVVAGEPAAVSERCAALYRELWSLVSPAQVSLVVATLSGGAEAQTWSNFGRALAAAAPLLDEGGAVALCTNLIEAPGQSLSRLINCDDMPKAARKITHDHHDDSVAAGQVIKALERGPVYLLSQLEPDIVEELGIAPIETLKDLLRLAERHPRCAVIDDAQRAIVTLG